MEIIKILRLVTGEDIISYIERYKEEVIVRSPMEIFLKNDPKTGNEVLFLNNWLPSSILKTNETSLSVHNLVCVMEPTKALIEYYENFVMEKESDVSNESELSASDGAELKSRLLRNYLQNLDPNELGPIQ